MQSLLSLVRHRRRADRKPRPAPTRLPRFRPRVETLEQREVPAFISWRNPVSGNWTDPANWTPMQVPGPNDDVSISVGAEAYTVTISSGSQTVQSLTNQKALAVTGGSLAITSNLSFTTSSSLTGTGTVDFRANGTIAGTVNLSGDTFVRGSVTFTGTLTGLGRLTVERFAALNSDATLSSLTLSGGGLLEGTGIVTVTGPVAWNDGRMRGSGRTVLRGGMNVVAGHLERVLDLAAGTSLINRLTLWGPGVLNNQAGSVLELRGSRLNVGTGVPHLNNAGILRKTGAGMSLFDRLNLTNTGTVQVEGGTLQLIGEQSEVNNHRDWTVSAGARLAFFTRSTFHPGSTLTGAGDVRFESGLMAGTLNVQGTTEFAFGFFSLRGTLTNVGSQVRLRGTVFFDVSATLNQLELEFGTIEGAGDVTVNGPFTWTIGEARGSGRLVARGGLTLVNGTLVGRTLDNVSATATVQGLAMGNGAVFNNASGSILQLTNNGFHPQAGKIRPVVNNAGTLRKRGPAEFGFMVRLNNSGTVEVEAGRLSLADVGVSTGIFRADAGTVLVISNGTLDAASAVTAAGRVDFGNVTIGGSVTVTGTLCACLGRANFTGPPASIATLLVNGTAIFTQDFTVATLNHNSGGTLEGSATITVTGPSFWNGGTRGTGRVVILDTLNLFGGSLFGWTLENRGTIVWTSGDLFLLDGAGLLNQEGATFEARTDRTFRRSGTQTLPAFVNFGHIIKSAGTGTSSLVDLVNAPILFHNQGTVEVQTGTLRVGGGESTGTFAVAAGAALEFARDEPTLQPEAGVYGEGTVRFAGGAAAMLGSYAVGGTEVTGGVVSFAGAVVDLGATLAVSDGGALLQAQGGIATAGDVWLGGGWLRIDGPVAVDNVSVDGGVLTLGAAGFLQVAGDYAQAAAGTLQVEIASLTDHGRMDVTGQAVLDGTLDVALLDDYRPEAGDGFLPLTFGSTTGAFADLTGDAPLFDLLYDEAGLTLVLR